MRITGDGSQYLGKRLLVGITYEDHEGKAVRQEQFHGLIVEAGAGGIVIERNDTGERKSLPPELMPARPGEYRLRSTGEVVVDPDYTATWVMRKSKEGGGDGVVIFKTAEEARAHVLGTKITGDHFELAISSDFTFAGRPDTMGAGMALVLDAILAQGYTVDGFEQRDGYRLYRYKPLK